MRNLLASSAILLASGLAAAAEELTVMSWGGAYTVSQVEAYQKPFMAQTGITINSVDADNPAAPIKAQVLAGNVTIDVATVVATDAARLCDEGLLEVLNLDDLPAAPDGTSAKEDFIEGALTDCSVASDVYSLVLAYDGSKTSGVSSIADFFDLEKFPGKRSLPKNPQGPLEVALLADGVPSEDIYEVLSTPEGVDRAFRKLDEIKAQTIWWEAGAQPPQLLADGEVSMAMAYNGRIFNAIVAEGKPFEILWDGQTMDLDVFVIPKGAPNLAAAWEYVKFATDTQRLADQTKWISYGPTRKSSLPMVSTYSDGVTQMAEHLPTAAENMENVVFANPTFWADNGSSLSERFNVWLASN